MMLMELSQSKKIYFYDDKTNARYGLDKINNIMKGSKMIHIIKETMIVFKPNCPEKFKPKNMTTTRPYEVIAEKTVKVSKDGKDYEDLHFGFIGDDYSLSFIASYNCHVVTVEGQSLTSLDDYYKYINKTTKNEKQE
jgi:hypothetical protein